MATAEDLLRAEEAEQAKIDALAASWEQDALERIDQLLHESTDRDADLWSDAGIASQDLTIDDYEDVPVDERGPDWVVGLSAIIAASVLQVFGEHRQEIIRAYKRRLRDVNGVKLSRSELVKAGKTGVSRQNIRQLAKQLRESGFVDAGDTDVDDITAKMSLADFISELQGSKMIGTWSAQQTAYAGDVQRMLERPPGSSGFLDGKSSLIGLAAGAGLLLLLRRSSQQYTTLVEIDGDESTDMVWITEGDANVCSECEPRGGQIRPYADWVRLGLPGASVCLGGNRCRCDLIKA